MRIGLVVVACGFVGELVGGCTRERTDPGVSTPSTGSTGSTGSTASTGSTGSTASTAGAGPTSATPPKQSGQPGPPGRALAAGHAPIAMLFYTCSHHDAPFGDGSQWWQTHVDLVAGTANFDRILRSGGEGRAPKPDAKDAKDAKDANDAKEDRSHSTTSIEPSKLRPFVDALEGGGPFADEYPVPEGISCKFVAADAKGNPLLSVEKAPSMQLDDAVVRLIRALPQPAPEPKPPTPPAAKTR